MAVKSNKDANAKKVATLLSKFRTERIDNPFDELQLTTLLKDNKCAYPKEIIKGLFKMEIMKKDDDGKLIFADPKPVHFSVIKKLHDATSKTVAQYTLKSKINKKDPDATRLLAAIQLIKSKGGEVRMPVTEMKVM